MNAPSRFAVGAEPQTHHHRFPVLDESGDLFGVVTIQDLERAKERGSIAHLRVRDVATVSVLTAFPDEPVWKDPVCSLFLASAQQ